MIVDLVLEVVEGLQLYFAVLDPHVAEAFLQDLDLRWGANLDIPECCPLILIKRGSESSIDNLNTLD
jgi:hypothetical protein